MKATAVQNKLKYFRYNKAKLGAKPGSIFIPKDALPTRVFEFRFHADFLEELEPVEVAEARSRTAPAATFTRWIDVRGLQNPELFDWLEQDFGIHPLELEDIASRQQPKVEEQFGHLFMVSRMLYLDQQQQVVNDQLSFFVVGNTLITIQETYEDVLEPVRNRLRNEMMPIRKRQSEYLAYALLDAVVDHYFLVLNDLGERMEQLENLLLTKPRREHRDQIMHLKHDLLAIRRIVWPTRELANNLLRNDHLNSQADIKIYLRDLYDHVVSLMDHAENYREISANLLDLYNTAVSNYMNEIMKVLTMISAIFIPLSFLAGLYGMNFVHESASGEPMPLNMPELYSPFGYITVIVVMVVIAIVQVLLFWKKGWFRKW
jgi:magnesium transporter